MSGFKRSKPRPATRCAACRGELHPHLVADVLAHAHATGSPVLFACPNCGATLTTAIRSKSATADKTE